MTDEQPTPRKRTARGRGEGTYSRLSDGRWVYQVSLGVGPDGKRQRPRFYGRTKEEARDAAEEARRQLRRGAPIRADRQRLSDYLDGWLAGLIHPASTMSNYHSMLKHVSTRMGHIRIGELRQEDIRRWQREMLDGGNTANTVNQAKTILSAALNDAIRADYIDRNPTSLVRAISYVPKQRTPLDADQSLTFLKHVRDSEYGPLYVVILGLGLRISEARGLLWSDIAKGVVTVQHQIRPVKGGQQVRDLKTGESGRRVLPMPEFVAHAVQVQRDRQRFERSEAGSAWVEGIPELVFKTKNGRPLSEAKVRADFKQQLAGAELPEIQLHELRHSCATLLLSVGVPMRVVQRILGHASMRTTEKYAAVLPSLTADAMERLQALLGGKEHQTGTGS